MRRSVLWLAMLLLTLPWAAQAQPWSAAAASDAAPALDLSFDPPVLAEPDAGPALPRSRPAPAARDAEAPFSLGVNS